GPGTLALLPCRRRAEIFGRRLPARPSPGYSVPSPSETASMTRPWSCLLLAALAASPAPAAEPTPAQAPAGVRPFFQKPASPAGPFRPGIDPSYEGMADTAYSDLAAVTYAVVLSRTFGWKLPHEGKTRQLLLSRQRPDGAFFNVKGTVDAKSAQAR